LKVFYKSIEFGDVNVSIYDNQQKKVFGETLRKINGFSRPYNLSALPAGTYTIRVSVGNREVSRVEQVVAEVKSRRFENIRKTETVAYVTTLKHSPGKYVLSIPARGEDHLFVRLYDERKSMIYSYDFDVDNEMAFVINIKSLTGKYLMEVETTDKIKNTFQLSNQ
jgi:hypothetical protein